MQQVHFKEDSRHMVVAEAFNSLEEAEQAADSFLEEMTSIDECGTHYVRVQVSGMPDTMQNGTYYFDVVTHL
ncbi:hypothetical protein [Deminuibacter soli]|uniref:Uncharacterized protein n=1 Tax=Deminuibacter soli TaxID=2291815 RepID=A0A3E1NGZ8_9BACT|nr:hypothetical protein [Deminuibacter soli]RFM27167.1 hypothetical protein DXN05_17050 [Deminuibacter soli]